MSGRRTARVRWLAAALLTLLGCDSGATAPEAGSAEIVLFAGDAQEGLPGQPLRWQIAVRAVDAAGEPAPGVSVRFTAAAGSGWVEHPRFVTGITGIAATEWTLGPSEVQGQSVRAELVYATDRTIGEAIVFHALPLPPERSDLLLAENAPEGPVRLVAYRRGGYDAQVAYQRSFADSLPILPFLEPAEYDEVFAVAPGRTALLAVPAWSGMEPCGTGVQAAIGDRRDRINVYYIGGIAIYSAYACNSRFIVMGDDSGLYGNLLAHEIGHTFGLGHEAFGSENLMNPNPGSALTDGQVYRALFGTSSSLNSVYGLRTAEGTRQCGSAVIDGVFRPNGECLPILFELEQ